MSTVAAIYARKSTEQNGLNDEAKSVARQIEHARACAAKEGWTVSDDHIYVDDGISGAEFAKRPGLMRLLNDLARRPPFGVLIISEESRLGRESFETGYVLKQILSAGVRIWCYLEDKELTLNSASDKILLAVTSVIADMERERARQRTRDAHLSKAEKGYVTGGVVFGYRNESIYGEGLDAYGQPKRQHVVRHRKDDEADIVRRIFDMRANGLGFKRIAGLLNEEGTLSPRPRRSGRPRSWTPSSVRGILLNPLYRGEVVWGRIQKRDHWGQKKHLDRPEATWVIRHDESLRIVSDELWNKAHAEIADARASHQRDGHTGGRPANGTESKYLLSGFAACACCGGGMYVWSRDFKTHRKHIYVCGYHHDRGSAVCANGLPMPMEEADAAVLQAVEHDLLREEVIDAAIEEAVQALSPSGQGGDESRKAVEAELAEVEKHLANYAAAIATAGPLDALMAEVSQREKRRGHLKRQLVGVTTNPKVASLDTARIKHDLRDRLTDWQGLLKRQTPETRQMLRNLLVGRLVFTPKEDERGRYYAFEGRGSVSAILSGIVSTGGSESRRGHHLTFRAFRGFSADYATRRRPQKAAECP